MKIEECGPAWRAKILDQISALDRFLAKVERRAFRIARIATGHREEALDVVQDAMFTLVRKYADRPEEEWPPLFHKILQSRIRDWYRRTKVRNRWRQWFGNSSDESEETSDAVENIPDLSTESPDKELARKRATMALEQALQNLPLRQQQVFLLRAWEGLNVAETAHSIGCSEGSVKTHYHRAIYSLRRILGDHWP